MVEITSVEFCQMTWVFQFKFSQTQRNSLPSFSGLCPFSWCTESYTFQGCSDTSSSEIRKLAKWCSQSIYTYSAAITVSDLFFMLHPAFRVFSYNNSFLFSVVVIMSMIDTALKNITHAFPLSPARNLWAIKTPFWAQGNASSFQGNASKTKNLLLHKWTKSKCKQNMKRKSECC